MALAEVERAQLTGEAAFYDDVGQVRFGMKMSSPVPWKVWLADDPPRLVVEFLNLEMDASPVRSTPSIASVRTETHAPNALRVIAELNEPLTVDAAEMVTLDDGAAVLRLSLSPTTGASFREMAKPLAEPPVLAGNPRTVVVIDPGHGGRDPGAEAGEVNEADLMLAFAKLLKAELEATGQVDVVLTRAEDIALHLEARIARARDANGDVFLSLHADRLRLDAGHASGLTVYTLGADLGAAASERQAERHGDAALKGVDLSGAGDEVALALMALQRQDTSPRAAALSRALVNAVASAGLAVNARPERQGDFAVLKAADIPSVLIELGFLSSPADLARLTSERWRKEAILALRDGILQWVQEDRVFQDARQK